MAIEIELKAWAGDPEERRGIISQFAGPAGEFLKEDTYWYPPSGSEGSSSKPGNRLSGALPSTLSSTLSSTLPSTLPSGVRVRREERRNPPGGGEDLRITRVCFKTKEKREGIEINDER
jgi:hypothetical protein